MAVHLPVSNPSPGLCSKPHQQRGNASTTSTAAVAAVAATPQTTRLSAPSIAVNVRHATPAAPVVMPERKKNDQSLASMWREIQGAGDWAGLVAPLHPLLRAEIVRYGELVAATYKAFDLDASSKRYLNCKYGKARMLEAVGMASAGYVVTRYIYAAPDVAFPGGAGPCPSRWIGYVAVASDDIARRLGRRDIIVSFRGTVTGSEWVANMMSSLEPARFDPADPRPDVKVESGFLSVYTSDDATCRFTRGSCRNQLLSEVTRLIMKYKHEEISITLAGHSMGSSLALLLGYDLAELGLNRDGKGNTVPITVYSFAGPRVGNTGFKNRCDELGVKVLRVVNVNDPITKLPGIFLNENSRVLGGRLELPWSCACYTHVGVELALDFFKARDPACVHDLEAYLGLLKCPKVAKVKKDGDDLMSKAKKFLLQQNFDTWRLQMAVIQVGELVQALGM
ncbi:phospholipase A1 EG1, chloroplastic/mitochondrial-like [Phragmites australis]|uniref:phospholipase A1 EG1, chloroplastic/mitochondrial-like n=1 Tax=Phragmites australis TaxID=29695 RepID=UPI002D76E8F4|nr:phospholipase A1 EG1, chloroplastic/mitochondrial-like [Phragmites australis]